MKPSWKDYLKPSYWLLKKAINNAIKKHQARLPRGYLMVGTYKTPTGTVLKYYRSERMRDKNKYSPFTKEGAKARKAKLKTGTW